MVLVFNSLYLSLCASNLIIFQFYLHIYLKALHNCLEPSKQPSSWWIGISNIEDSKDQNQLCHDQPEHFMDFFVNGQEVRM